MIRLARPACLLLVSLALGCAPNHAQLGRNAFGRGDYGLAIRELSEATREHPEDAELWRDLARAHMRAIQPEQAATAIARAFELEPNDANTVLVRGQVSMALDKRDEALTDARFVVQNGKSARALQETAILLLRLHEADEAIGAARRAVELSKNDPTAYANLAVLAVEAGQPDVAVAAFEEGRRIHPEHVGLAEAQAAWLASTGQLAPARDAYRELLKIHPEPGLIHLAIALLSHALGDLTDARTHSQAAVDASGKERADVHYTHVVVLRDSGDQAGAREHLAQARRRFPGDEDLARLAASMEGL